MIDEEPEFTPEDLPDEDDDMKDFEDDEEELDGDDDEILDNGGEKWIDRNINKK